MSFEVKFKQLDAAMMDLLMSIRNRCYDEAKAIDVKDQLISLYKDTVRTDEGRNVTKLAEITSIIMEELNGFVCDTDDTDAGVKADDIHSEIAYALEQIAEGKE